MRRAAALLLVALLSACSPTAEPAGPDRLSLLFDDSLRVIDLTHALSADSSSWPSPQGNPFEHRIVRAHPSGAAAMAAYSTPEHHGTHLDAPVHGVDGGATVDLIEPAELFGPAVVIDVSTAAANDADYVVTRADLEGWEGRHGEIPRGAIVLMSSGWSRKYGDPAAYSNEDEEGRMHFPGFSVAAAEFLVQERDISGIGVDTLSVDPGSPSGFPVHGVVNPAGKFQLENVANLHELPESGAYLVVAPIKIAGGSGGQVRIFAIIP